LSRAEEAADTTQTDGGPDPVSAPAHLLVRVRLPDRPGALGQVASRIGAVRGDIVRIDVLQHGGDEAVDEFALRLADLGLVPVLVREIGEVDGATVESVRAVEVVPDARLDALDSITELLAAQTVLELAELVCVYARRELHADWCSFVQGDRLLAVDGVVAATSPSVAECPLAAAECRLRVGRNPPFHPRERAQLEAIGRLTDGLWALVVRHD